ncbi:glycogen debranching N-terminal domain-containing protein [Hyphomicrobium sp. 802]|uniref:amylo-alpha-1,6-glucosidase n=1 Tax=Hyphomicrobium sp. 802 TaxID=1112272 RepID=UPI00045EAB71|nr:glycogen debranching N-terminal domain-containing protein [Hyphomicrobium sp. 802]
MAVAPSRQPDHDENEIERIHAEADSSPRTHETLKHDDAFAVVDTHGDVGAFGNHVDGFFFNDTRYLSRLELLIARHSPLLLGSTLDSKDLQLCCDLTNTDVFAEGTLWLHKDVVHVFRTTYVREAALRQRLVFTNHSNVDLMLPVSLIFDADFADIFEVRGMRREKHGSVKRVVDAPDAVRFVYSGLDNVVRQTTIHIDPEPASLKETSAFFHLHLPAKQSKRVFITASAGTDRKQPPCSYAKGLRDAHRAQRRIELEAASIRASNSELDQVLSRALADLRLLVTETEDGPYPYAGTPWYSTTFGRDALITALQVLWLDPSIARGVLRRLARYQAVEHDAAADAQPGKILHEMRNGEMAALREIPFGLYYGSVDSTPLFVVLAGAYVGVTGDTKILNELWPAILKALEWIDGPGDPDGDGFVEYARETEAGLANQGWKDSHDSVFHSDGSLAQGPLALVEVQGYVYAAKIAAARMAEILEHREHAENLRTQATALQQKFEREFWSPEIGTYAIALDGAKKRVAIRSSNAGHMLSTGIASPDRACSVVQQMLSPGFFSGWGIRTIATTEARYNPMSYHNGSIWPHDNAMIGAGFARYGQTERIEPVFDGVLDAALKMSQGRLPELFCGFRRRPGRAPILYPVACSPQAWASGAMLHMVSSLMGLEIDGASRTITLRSPRLPLRAGEIEVRNIRAGEGSADFVLRRHHGVVTIDVTNCRGGVKVVMA